MAKRDIVVIGGSTGSGAVLKQIVAELPTDFPAAVFVSTHIPAHVDSLLPDMLASAAKLPVSRATDGQPIEKGRIYVAAPDRHLLLLNGAVALGVGPRENMVRPAIDAMFRSAALSYGPRVVGVVVTGMLNDGASGLHAIKQAGGVAVVQHPLDAQADDMPRAALEAVEVDHVARAADLGLILNELVREDARPQGAPSKALEIEVMIAAGARLGSDRLREFAEPAPLTCPECQGVLSEVKGERPLRFRCQIGHAYSAELLSRDNPAVDEAVRIAMRVMEERVELVQRMARDARQAGRTAVAELYESRAEEYRGYAAVLRRAATSSLRMERPPGEQPV